MTVRSVHRDEQLLTLTVTSAFDAPIDQVWLLWADPRKLERWWGPPTYPATFERHELVRGGAATYFMTGPGGEQFHGWWHVVDVDPPHSLEVDDGFADAEGTPNPELPTTRMSVRLAEHAGATVMTITSRFASAAAMQQMVEMGMEEGLRAALGQADELLAA